MPIPEWIHKWIQERDEELDYIPKAYGQDEPERLDESCEDSVWTDNIDEPQNVEGAQTREQYARWFQPFGDPHENPVYIHGPEMVEIEHSFIPEWIHDPTMVEMADLVSPSSPESCEDLEHFSIPERHAIRALRNWVNQFSNLIPLLLPEPYNE